MNWIKDKYNNEWSEEKFKGTYQACLDWCIEQGSRMPLTWESLRRWEEEEIFPEDKDYFWSSSSNANDANDAWVVDFYNGNVFNGDKGNYYYVRCVKL